MKPIKYLLIFYLCLTSVPLLAVNVGQPVDMFRYRDLEGTYHADTDYRNKVLVLAVIGYN